jgi:hypothetical protein
MFIIRPASVITVRTELLNMASSKHGSTKKRKRGRVMEGWTRIRGPIVPILQSEERSGNLAEDQVSTRPRQLLIWWINTISYQGEHRGKRSKFSSIHTRNSGTGIKQTGSDGWRSIWTILWCLIRVLLAKLILAWSVNSPLLWSRGSLVGIATGYGLDEEPG